MPSEESSLIGVPGCSAPPGLLVGIDPQAKLADKLIRVLDMAVLLVI
jgi:hypothetical protein